MGLFFIILTIFFKIFYSLHCCNFEKTKKYCSNITSNTVIAMQCIRVSKAKWY